jgi:hypothetical protein
LSENLSVKKNKNCAVRSKRLARNANGVTYKFIGHTAYLVTFIGDALVNINALVHPFNDVLSPRDFQMVPELPNFCEGLYQHEEMMN